MRVRDIMTKNVKVVRPDMLVREAAQMMCFHKLSSVPVVSTDNHILGILCEKDLLWAMFTGITVNTDQAMTRDFEDLEHDYDDVAYLPVSELMTRDVITVSAQLPVLQAASRMLRNRIRRVPVAEHGRLTGIISVGDIHNAILRSRMTEARPVAGCIAAAG